MFNSVRMRLTAWYSGVLALVLLLFAVSTYLFLSYAIERQTDESLQEVLNGFTDFVEREKKDSVTEEDEISNAQAVGDVAEDLIFRNYQVFVFDAQNNFVAATVSTPNRANLSNEILAKLQADFSSQIKAENFYTLRDAEINHRLFVQKILLDGENFSFWVEHALNDDEALLQRFFYALLFFVPLALLIAGFGGYFLARKSLSPVVAMSETAKHISAKNLHERLPVENERDELGFLAGSFNALLERLDNSFARQKRFMADASHELRTPIAIVRGESEVALLKDERTAADYRESLAIVHAESKRMSRLVEDLFTLARADAGQVSLVKTEFYLDELLGECVRAVKSLADKRGVSLALDAEREMLINADEELLKRLFFNLLDNAIKYTPADGWVKIRAEISDSAYSITVADTGKGISEEDRKHIFERFYRADKARSRGASESGAGLGLSISLWISEAHDGKLKLVKSDANGSAFLVELPSS